ncbi:MAG: YIP1 family protein [Candidatus Kapabacteria bacterium]|jgi:hypothetical protein|nr:YIP1 family protein [Candidatus Kapabacteria bacterium]
MQENYENEFEAENLTPIEDAPSIADRMVGVFTSPAALFEKLAVHPPKAVDWLIPVLIVAVITVLSTFLQMNDPEIVYQMQKTQKEKMEAQFQSLVEKGWMTEEAANAQMEKMDEGFSEESMKSGIAISAVTIPLFLLAKLFFVALIYFIIARFILKGQGGYSQALTVYGTAHYIVALQALVLLIIILVTGKITTGTSIASLGGFDNTTILGFLLSKVNVFSLLILYSIGVGLSKMYHAESSGMYLAIVFGLWIGGSFIIFLLGNLSPYFYDLAAGI